MDSRAAQGSVCMHSSSRQCCEVTQHCCVIMNLQDPSSEWLSIKHRCLCSGVLCKMTRRMCVLYAWAAAHSWLHRANTWNVCVPYCSVSCLYLSGYLHSGVCWLAWLGELEHRLPFCDGSSGVIIIMLPNQAIASTPSAPRPSGAEGRGSTAPLRLQLLRTSQACTRYSAHLV
jgi:hypothetical protein